MWGGDWYDFYIVEKDNSDSEESESQKLVEIIWKETISNPSIQNFSAFSETFEMLFVIFDLIFFVCKKNFRAQIRTNIQSGVVWNIQWF